MLLIVGRTGSGKDTYAKCLEEFGLKGICSYTTRSRREGEGDTHIFINKNEIDNYPNKIALTEIKGNTYFATVEQFNNADFYIIDPKGIRYLNEHFPELTYRIVYIYANYSIRKNRAVNRVTSIEEQMKEAQIFIERDKAENGQFKSFENSILYNTDIIIHNNNNLTLEELKNLAKQDINR